MKQELDRQIDSLLRGTRAGGAGVARPAAHLTPDELSAYAENALPQTARAHYAAHLADCADCRRIVTSIALAAAEPAPATESEHEALVAAASNTRAAVGPTWRERLAALFAPRLLAYAAPVLALAIVGAVALVVFRGREDSGASPTQVAQQRPAEGERRESVVAPQATPLAPADQTVSGAAGANASGQTQQSPGAPPVAGPGIISADKTDAPGPLADLRMEKKAADSTAPADERSVSEAVGVTAPAPAKAAQQPVLNEPAPVAAAAAPPRPAAREVQSEDEVAEQRRESQPENAKRAENDARRQRDYNVGRDDVSNNVAGRAARRGGGEAERGRSGARRDGEDFSTLSRRKAEDREEGSGRRSAPSTSTAATRYAAGHEFRRQNGEWVDVDYRSSMATSNYRRDSDSFRALVADHPIIGRVAAEISGTFVIVVGRAYRIY